jgi:hypothetical protein
MLASGHPAVLSFVPLFVKFFSSQMTPSEIMLCTTQPGADGRGRCRPPAPPLLSCSWYPLEGPISSSFVYPYGTFSPPRSSSPLQWLPSYLFCGHCMSTSSSRQCPALVLQWP